jgi:integrase
MLKDVTIRQAKPRAKPYKLYDAKGLFLIVTPNGGRWWRLRYRWRGKERLISLGIYPGTTLADARRARNEALDLLRAGIDPSQHRRDAARNTFENVALEWHAHQSPKWSKAHADRVLGSLATEAFPSLGAREITDLKPAEIVAALRAIESRGAQEVASRVLQRVAAVCRYAVQTGRATYNPASDLRGALAAKPRVVHRAALSREQLPAFMATLRAAELHPVTRAGLWLALLTVARTGELRGMRWAEIDGDVWRIPAERMKMREPHVVPLSCHARGVLDGLKPITGHLGLVLAGEREGKPISENTLLYAMHRLGYKGTATVHGFRALFSTIANEFGCWNADAIERQLAHAERNAVRAAYHRAEYLDERRRLLEWWGEYLDAT